MVKDTETICFKITESIEILEKCVETKELDAPRLAKLLHKIRQDATKMEDALKTRKRLMVEHGIENKYKKVKEVEDTPTGINKVANKGFVVTKDKYFELTVENNGEVVYKNKVRAGVLCVAEDVVDFDKSGHMNGRTQHFFFGKTLHWWYCYNQIQHAIEGKKIEIMVALKQQAEKIGIKL